ncbi:hypothetical protein GCM10007884_21910 [Methylobacterium brachythecii]|nr:hypothetical protein GCM10007884_21910 [Methylobacterium brachythecii]
MEFQLRIIVCSTGPGRWTDCVSIAAASVADATEQANIIAALSPYGIYGEAALYDAVGRQVWQSEVTGRTRHSSDVETSDNGSSTEQA